MRYNEVFPAQRFAVPNSAHLCQCSLLMSGFSDVLVFQSTSSGSIFHVNYSTPVQAPLNGTCPAPPSSVKFKTSTYVGTPKEGPVPLNLESVYKEPEAVPEQQSFFRKYW